MPKIKTHKSTSKRFRYSKGGKGKTMRTHQGKSHLRRKKSLRSRQMFDEMTAVRASGTCKRIQRLAPYLRQKSS